MRVLIAGSGGFIGSAVTEQLRRDGAEIYRVQRRSGDSTAATFDAATRSLDLSGLPGGSLDGFDAVYALGGDPLTPRRWSPSKSRSIWSSRIDVVDALARAVARTSGKAPTLITMSAVGIYGERGDEELDESSAAGSGFLADLCRAWEHATSPALTNGGRVVIGRAGIVLGRGGGMIGNLEPLFRLGLGARLGSGRQWMSWIALEDIAHALVRFATDDALNGTFNLTAPNPVRNAEFTKRFAAVLHRPAPLAVPKSALVALAGRRVADEFLLQSARVLPSRLAVSGFTFALAGLDEAIAASVGRPLNQ
jgi:uncharacterized protein (TIGR01777 family)